MPCMETCTNSRLCLDNASILLWCNMSVMVSMLPATRFLAKRLFRLREAPKLRITGPLWGIPPVIGGFPHKGAVIRKAFPCHDVNMYTSSASLMGSLIHQSFHFKLGITKKSQQITYELSWILWGLWCQEQVCHAGISKYIPQFIVGCNYLCLHEIPASDTKVLIHSYGHNSNVS